MEAWKATVLLMVTLVLPKATVLLMMTLVAEGEGADGEEVPDHVAEGEGADQPLGMESDGSPR